MMSFSTVYVEYSDSLSLNLSGPTSHDTLDVCDTGVLTTILGAYSRTQVARTIRQRSYDVDRSYDTTYSQS